MHRSPCTCWYCPQHHESSHADIYIGDSHIKVARARLQDWGDTWLTIWGKAKMKASTGRARFSQKLFWFACAFIQVSSEVLLPECRSIQRIILCSVSFYINYCPWEFIEQRFSSDANINRTICVNYGKRWRWSNCISWRSEFCVRIREQECLTRFWKAVHAHTCHTGDCLVKWVIFDSKTHQWYWPFSILHAQASEILMALQAQQLSTLHAMLRCLYLLIGQSLCYATRPEVDFDLPSSCAQALSWSICRAEIPFCAPISELLPLANEAHTCCCPLLVISLAVYNT